MGWLDAVKNFATKAATNIEAGQHPDVVLKRAQLADEFKNSEVRRQMEQASNARQEQELGMKAEEANYKKTLRPVEEMALRAGADSAVAKALQERYDADHQNGEQHRHLDEGDAQAHRKRIDAGGKGKDDQHLPGRRVLLKGLSILGET